MDRAERAMMRTFTAAMAALLFAGCGGRMIQSPVVSPEAEIRATDANVEITRLIEDYANALGAMDVERLHGMVSNRYYENGGTTDRTDDDYGYAGVLSMMEQLRDQVRDVRVEISVHEIRVAETRAEVLFEYALTMLYRVGDQDRWQTGRDFARLELERENGRWMITSGL